MPKILVVDNYDSFVFTIVSYLRQLGADVVVVRNDHPSLAASLTGFDGVVVSPGPGHPKNAGHSLEVVGWCAQHSLPMLGVCLGHQALAEYFGAQVARAPQQLHGKTSTVVHNASGVFDAVPSPVRVTRYHSLAVLPQTVPEELVVNATTEDGVVMGLQHRELPLYGVQFHPESVLTEYGYLMVANWLALAGGLNAVERSKELAPLLPGDSAARW